MKESEIINDEPKIQPVNLTALYEKLSDIPSRLRFLVDMKKTFIAKNTLNQTVSQNELDEADRLLDSFVTKYVTKGNSATQKLVFETLGSISAENNYDCYREYDDQLNYGPIPDELLPADKKERPTAAMWMMDHSSVGMSSRAVSAITDTITKSKSAPKSYQTWMNNGLEEYYKQNNIVGRKREIVNEIANRNLDENSSYQSIKDWTATVEEEFAKPKREKASRRAVNSFIERYDEGLKDNLKEDQLIWEMRTKYKQADSMEAKLDCLIEYATKDSIRSQINVTYNDANTLYFKMVDDFAKKYIVNGTPDSAKKVFELIGKKTIENTKELMEIDAAYREEFKSEGKTGIRKADAMAWRSIPGIKAKPIDQMTQQLRERFQQQSIPGFILWNKSKLSIDSTIDEYAKQIGIAEADIPAYLEKNHAVSGTKVIDCIIDEDCREKPDKALFALESRFYRDVCNEWLQNGSKDVIKTFDKSKFDLFTDIKGKINSEINYSSSIVEWIDGPGKKRYNDLFDCTVALIGEKPQDKNIKVKSYEDYIKLHTGKAVFNSSPENQKDCFIKALTANFLRSSGKEFNISTIDKYTEMMKNNKQIQKLISDKEAFKKAISSPENLADISNEIFGESYLVAPENVSKYVKDMYRLSKSMMTSKGRSKEYKAYSNSVNQIADLYGKYDFTIEADRIACSKELRGLNFALVNSAQNYMSGKKTYRASNDGNERFNNTLDSLAILSEHSPNLKNFVQKQVDSINKVREAFPGSYDYVNIKDYGAKRAIAAKKLREPKPKAKAKKNTEPKPKVK